MQVLMNGEKILSKLSSMLLNASKASRGPRAYYLNYSDVKLIINYPTMAASTKTGKSGGKKSSSKSKSRSSEKYGIEESKLLKLFEDSLKDIYWAEKALTKALPKMVKKATSDELVQALENHLEETEQQVTKVEQVFEIIGKKAVAKKCEAMNGLIKEAEEIMKESEDGAMRDAGIIAAAQKVEHYEIATYGTLRTFAQTLGLNDAAALLESILEEEKNADETLTSVAESTINVNAAEEELEEAEEEEEEEE
jgi:ferritin-like metal-binding protein YciE